MLYIKKPAQGDTGGRVVANRSTAWYDGRNQRLATAFEELSELEDPPLTAPRIRYLVILAVCLGATIIQECILISLALCVVAGLLFCSPWLVQMWQHKVYRAAVKDRLKDLERGEYGSEFMWENDPLWAILDELLAGHGLSMATQIMLNLTVQDKITPTLSELIRDTQNERRQLRELRIVDTRSKDDRMLYPVGSCHAGSVRDG